MAGLNLDGDTGNKLYGDRYDTNKTEGPKAIMPAAETDLLGDLNAPEQKQLAIMPAEESKGPLDNMSVLQDVLGGGAPSVTQPSSI